MTRPEDRLRAALDARAATAQPAPDALARIRDRVGRRRRTGVLVGATAAAAVVGGVASGVYLVRDDRPARIVTPAPSETPTPSPHPTPSPDPTPETTPSTSPLADERVAAVTASGSVVVASAETGEVLTTAYRPRSEERTLGVAFAPDRSWVYFGLHPAPGRPGPHGSCPSVYRVRPDGTDLQALGMGSEPVVSPDGTRLVVMRRTICAQNGEPGIAVIDLSTRDARFYSAETDSYLQNGVPVDLAWEDDRMLFVLLGWEAGMGELRRLDTAHDDRVHDGERLPWKADTADDLAVGRGRTPVLAFTDHTYPPDPATKGWVDKIDRATGRPVRLFEVPEIEASSLAVDPRGAVVYVGAGGALWRWHGDAKPVLVGGAFSAVDW